MMKGEGIKAGIEIEGAKIVDLAPSVLYLLGFPIPNEMDGEVPEAAFTEEYLRTHKISLIDEKPVNLFSQEIYSDREEEELKKHLRALGYLD